MTVRIIAAILTLASLDLLGSFYAREWALQRTFALALAGAAAFVALFVVYALSLRMVDLVVVTFGWIAVLQVGVVVLEVVRYGTRYPADVWVAAAVTAAGGGWLAVRAS